MMKDYLSIASKQLRHVVLLAAMSSTFACTDGVTDLSAGEIDELIPLAIKNLWVFKHDQYDTNGSITYSWIDTLRVTRDTVIANEKWYSTGSSVVWTTNRKDGYYSYWLGFAPILEYKYPAVPGDTIKVTPSLLRIVMATNDTISVNNSLYVAYRYLELWPGVHKDTSWNIYITPNLGYTRIETVANLPASKRVLTRTDLMSHRLD